MDRSNGSEWRKWDLHLHTPNTHLANNYNGNWDEYLKRLSESDISVFGITNYFCFNDGEVEKVAQHLNALKKVVLPNLEFRIQQPNKDDEYINLHVIFSNEFSHNTIKISACIGKVKLINTQSNQKDLYCDHDTISQIGYDKALIDWKHLISTLESNFTYNKDFIIVASPRGLGGFRPQKGDGRGNALAIEIDKYCHAVFGSREDVDFFLKEDRFDGAKPKPIYKGSDAHKLDDIGKGYTWIKSDCNFDGLRQTLYEPKYRCKVQEHMPTSKDDFQIIDKIRFLTNTPHSTFSNEYIHLNPDLNAIIGGKSSGKSLLLYYIAKTIDTTQVRVKADEVKQQHYNFEITPGFDFEITWRDGEVYTLRGNTTKNRLITYIPQLYINHIAERGGEEALNDIILTFLEQKKEFADFHENKQKEIGETTRKIKDSINEFFQVVETLVQKRKDLAEKGDKIALIANKANIIQQIELLRSSSNFTEQEELSYQLLLSRKELHESRVVLINKFQKTLLSFDSSIRELKDNAIQKIILHQTSFDDLDIKYTQGINSIITSTLNDTNIFYDKILEKLRSYNTKIDSIHEINEICINGIREQLSPFLLKITDTEKLTELQNKKLQHENALQQIAELEKEVAIITKKGTETISKIKADYQLLHTHYLSIKNELNSKYREISTDRAITLKSTLAFDTEKFNDTFSTQITKNSYLRTIFGNYFDDDNYYVYNELSHVENIFKIFSKVISNEKENIRFNKSWTRETVINALLEDNFKIEYKLLQKGEEISKMSPGKKGLILLILLLHLNNSKYPILIDQPEDNLDNRTIYRELKEYIKQKKEERQIIIVTHNSNLVVTTDAENVVVANRQGEEKEKNNAASQFEYINGALENSYKNSSGIGVLKKMGIKEHVCDILEGGELAFKERESKYDLEKLV